MSVSPCKSKKCENKNRKVCSRKCRRLAEYRKALGDPLVGLNLSVLGHCIDTGIGWTGWTPPTERDITKEEDY